MKVLKVKITLTTECLGTNPADKDIFSEFIASNAPDAKSRKEEIEEIGAQEYEEKSVTVHAKDKDGKPFLWDYQLKGFFKSALLLDHIKVATRNCLRTRRRST